MKIKKLVSAIAALTMSVSAFAGLTLNAQAVVDKEWDFTAFTKDKTAVTYSGSVTVGGTGCDKGTGTYEGLAFQGAGSWLERTAGYLYNGNGGGRMFAVLNLVKGQTVTIKTNASSNDFILKTTADLKSYDVAGSIYTYTYAIITDTADFGVSLTRYYSIYSITVESPDPLEEGIYEINKVATDSATVTVSEEQAAKDTVVTVTPVAKDGYEAPFTINVVDAEGNVVTVNSDNTFAMPASAVTVSATATPRALVSEATVNYTFNNATIKSETVTISGDKRVGQTGNVPYRKYIFEGGKLYQTSKRSSDPNYGTPTVLSENTSVDIALTEVALNEGETAIAFVDLDGTSSDNAGVRCSNMAASRPTSVDVAAVEPGIYKIENISYSRNNMAYIYLNDTEIKQLNLYTSGAWGSATTTDIVITEPGTLSIKAKNEKTDFIDYILLIKTGDIEVAPEVTFASRAEYRYDGNGIGSLNFVAAPQNADGEITAYGFWFINFGDTTTIKASASGTETLENGQSFYLTKEGIALIGSDEDGNDVPAKSVEFWAIPWVKIGDKPQSNGKAFRYGGAITQNEGDNEVYENTVYAD